MNLQERGERDAKIMKLVHAGVTPLTIAKRLRLTVNRINQIIERERCKSKRSTRSASRARAVKVR
jgi:hypothetical protein